ncbi:MAG: hypothetical protein J7L66_05230 [Anaerolineaceae bacterium]|nr:hypothetical protein [Anaerolineaceae bacterium]
MEKKKRSARLILVCVLIISFTITSAGICQDESINSESYQRAVQLVRHLSPEEKIGQLFLITIDGTEVGEESEIFELINDFYVGGVVLNRSNNNFSDEDTLTKIYDLVSNIQRIEWESRNKKRELPTGNIINDYIPLFIGISQSGGLYPYDQIISGITNIPSQMAVSATWDTTYANKIGKLNGSELEALGFNLLLGPSLDVLDITYNEEEMNLGVQSYGGDPYWVGEMGAAYIEGVHNGSRNRIAVIARNFPGRGSTDRFPEEEVATVRKSFDQLQMIDLAPFLKITGRNENTSGRLVDGLLNSHIRYQGFQGNIRATTKPISFDKDAVELIMGLPPLDTWRKNGGILVSDDLGSHAVYKFFNPNGKFIDARQVVRNAFLAGNDILYMDQLVSSGDEDRFSTYKETIDLFVQKYKEDQAFAERVDDSIVRILTLKFNLYQEFNLENVIPDARNLQNLGEGHEIVFEVANKAATLINPLKNQVNESIPSPPQFGERIVIFTDNQPVKQCGDCQLTDIFPVNGLQKAILKLYGPDGSSQISENQIISYSFKDLDDFVEDPFNRPQVEENLSKAKWVIFAIREVVPDQPHSYALHKLIAKSPTILRDKNVIVFTFDIPFLFDATEISTFTAYYAMYSKLPAFVEVAARIIFQEVSPQGASPVSIPGVAYDLNMVTKPNPEQIISLSVDEDAAKLMLGEKLFEDNSGEEESNPPTFKLGDNLPIITGVIYDQNQNPVPDGTVVRFTMNEQGTTTTIQQVESETENGIAKASIVLQNSGMHEIKVSSEPALNSQILLLDISEEEAIVSAIIPTLIPTQDEKIGEETAGIPERIDKELEKNNKVSEWLIATIVSWASGIAGFYFLRNYLAVDERVKISNMGILGGLFSTAWLIFDLPGSTLRYGLIGYLKLIFLVLVWVLLGGGLGWLYIKFSRSSSEEK